MRQIEKQMVAAMKNCQPMKNSNTKVTVNDYVVQVFLHDNPIAVLGKQSRDIRITNDGFPTMTTKSRLNAILRAFAVGWYIRQVKGEWYLYYNLKEIRRMDSGWVNFVQRKPAEYILT